MKAEAGGMTIPAGPYTFPRPESCPCGVCAGKKIGVPRCGMAAACATFEARLPPGRAVPGC